MRIGVVVARAGSKGVPNKNIIEIQGVSLLERAVRIGVRSPSVDRVFISTDSEEYLKIARAAGAQDFGLRPPELATDNSSTVDVLLDLFERPELNSVENFVLLQPTSPIRTIQEIEWALGHCTKTGQSVVSVSLIDDPHPLKTMRIECGALRPYFADTRPGVPRQSLEPAYALTGAIYVCSKRNLIANRSLYSDNTFPLIQQQFANIDSLEDVYYLNYLLSSGGVEID